VPLIILTAIQAAAPVQRDHTTRMLTNMMASTRTVFEVVDDGVGAGGHAPGENGIGGDHAGATGFGGGHAGAMGVGGGTGTTSTQLLNVLQLITFV